MATATTTAVAQLNKVQYAGLDFPTHFDDLRSELQTKFAADFNDFALSSLAIMLLDITAYGLDSLSFYLDRRATDAYLETAQTRKAVARLTRQLGYKMGGAISASTDLDVSIATAVNFNVTIPQGFQFRGPNNLIFEAAQATTYAPRSVTPQSIPVYEGETLTETFVGDGTANQVFELQRVPAGKAVVQNSALVLVNGTPYTEAEFLPVTGGQFFEIGYNDAPATLRFGDGTVSQNDIPALNSTISITYIASTGLAGQVNANTITRTVNPLVVNFTTISLSINNPEGAVGGDDPESLERAKTLAPLVYKSRRVAVTQSDYVALASAYADPLFGRVAVAQAYSARSAASDLELQSLLQDVRDVVSPVYTDVTTQLTALGVRTTTIGTQLTTVSGNVPSIGTQNTTADSALGTATTGLTTASNTCVLASSRCSAGITTVSAIASGASDQLTTATRNAINAIFTTLISDITSVQTSVDTSNTNAASARTNLATVGLSPASGLLLSTQTAVTAASAANTYISGTISPAIAAEVAPLSPTGTGTGTVNAALDAVSEHEDAILSANCAANLVTVPILTKDANGFYSAPSIGLKQSLQNYLDARKAVTQTVSVTSGEGSLIYAVLNIQVGVSQGFSEAVVRLAVQTALDGLLKNRVFGADLYRSNITDTVLGVSGAAFVNPTITGYYTSVDPTVQTTKLDGFGNLIVEESEVITKGTVTVTTVPYAGTTL